ncbi:MAG: hypothetical protein QOF51_1492 [Chloroflexota bacterium]|jgi:hypothetical protein|nr:hypothetical protein [Chloroflexota bacterium]
MPSTLQVANSSGRRQLTAGLGISTAPLLADGKVMLGGRDGAFYGVDSAAGSILWRYDAGAPILMTAAYDDGKAFFGSMDMYIHAVNTSDGTRAWRSTQLPGAALKDYWPIATHGKLIVRAELRVPVNGGIQHVRFANRWLKQFAREDPRTLLKVAAGINLLKEVGAALAPQPGEVNAVGVDLSAYENIRLPRIWPTGAWLDSPTPSWPDCSGRRA